MPRATHAGRGKRQKGCNCTYSSTRLNIHVPCQMCLSSLLDRLQVGMHGSTILRALPQEGTVPPRPIMGQSQKEPSTLDIQVEETGYESTGHVCSLHTWPSLEPTELCGISLSGLEAAPWLGSRAGLFVVGCRLPQDRNAMAR